MLAVIVIAAIAVLAAMVFLITGRGGELSTERNDYLPLDLGPVSATDIALMRPPMGLWGYNVQVTDEAMEQIADAIKERDVRIVALEQLVTDLSRDHAPMQVLGSPYTGARHRRTPADTTETETETQSQTETETEQFEGTRDAPPTEPVRFPFEPPRPGGELSGPPPERSHD